MTQYLHLNEFVHKALTIVKISQFYGKQIFKKVKYLGKKSRKVHKTIKKNTLLNLMSLSKKKIIKTINAHWNFKF